GAGLVENTPDATLTSSFNSTANARANQGIAGRFNTSGNDGTITRFGWKAQNKSLMVFAGEAYNVEQGVSNEMFPQERPNPDEEQAVGLDARCKINATPEDHTNFNTTAVGTPSDAVQFAMFMRLLKPAAQSATTPGGTSSIINGEAVFTDIGCAACHRRSFTTTASDFTSDLDNKTAVLWSDLQIHHMGSGLADNVTQGNAGGDQFRTAPLWGLGQRLFFLHDGRTANLVQVINAHSSAGSEANNAVSNYYSLLTTSQQQDLLNFLRSL
ncbi:MAG: thiol oxidoreductase, partial [Acidobacteria bacterium]|nr:thiol oxidoreductase [Acidobacteriota bacterium]